MAIESGNRGRKKVCSTSEVKVVKKLNMKIYPILLPEGRRKKNPA